MQLFYQEDIQENNFLNEEEAKHVIRVLRLIVGDELNIFNGKGDIFHCRIHNISGKKVEIQKVSKEHIEPFGNFKLHIAIAPTKNIARYEWFLEKATEIGIDEITPILCERSERKVINHERLNKILISAIKQSKNPYLPKLNSLTPFNTFISNSFNYEKYIAHCNNDNIQSLKSLYKKDSNALILIGPEGDFSKQEVKTATLKNFIEINLGSSRLRTETAGIVSCHTINLINQKSNNHMHD